MAYDKAQLRAAARAIEDRLNELALSQADAANRAGLSTATIRELRTGTARRYTPKTIRLVEQALDWPRGTLTVLLTGEGSVDGQPAQPVVRRAESVEEVAEIVKGEIADLDPVDAVALLRKLARQILAEANRSDSAAARPSGSARR